MKITSALLIILTMLFFGCRNPKSSEQTPFEIINSYRPDLGYTEAQVSEIMQLKSFGSTPCGSDYNEDGVINSGDLIILLPLIGTKGYSTAQLNQLLAAFGQEYIIEVIISYNNWIDTVFGCANSASWEVYNAALDRWLIRKRCNGTFTWYANFDSLHWVYDGEIISRVEERLRFQTYLPDGSQNICEGWQPPCNAINSVGMRVFDNNHAFYREALGYAAVNDVPDSIPVCGDSSMAENLFGTSFLPYEFLEY